MKTVKEYILINVGLVMTSLSIYLFKIPDKFATGGVSGLSIVVEKYLPQAPVGLIMLVTNIILVLVGFIIIGRGFGAKTVYCSFMLSGLVWFFEKLYPITVSLTGDKLLELIFSVMLYAIGAAIIFNQNASTGGTDIIARMFNKYTHMDIGKALLAADFAIVLAAGVAFGVKSGMYSFLGVIMKGFLVDTVINGLNLSKQVIIISSKPEEVKRYIITELHRGATVYKARGAYTNSEEEVITTVLNRRQAVKLKYHIKAIDFKAFVTISNTAEIIGRGFEHTDL